VETLGLIGRLLAFLIAVVLLVPGACLLSIGPGGQEFFMWALYSS
jgi:hypothetical protein